MIWIVLSSYHFIKNYKSTSRFLVIRCVLCTTRLLRYFDTEVFFVGKKKSFRSSHVDKIKLSPAKWHHNADRRASYWRCFCFKKKFFSINHYTTKSTYSISWNTYFVRNLGHTSLKLHVVLRRVERDDVFLQAFGWCFVENIIVNDSSTLWLRLARASKLKGFLFTNKKILDLRYWMSFDNVFTFILFLNKNVTQARKYLDFNPLSNSIFSKSTLIGIFRLYQKRKKTPLGHIWA